MNRTYDQLLTDHLSNNRQMLFLAGPRQVGKTTCAKLAPPPMSYMNWDDISHRRTIMRGADKVSAFLDLDSLRETPLTVVFDELHKYSGWESFLKGFYDVYTDTARIIVTGSARLNVFQSGGDSLMGRYFLYRMHPLSLGEFIHPDFGTSEIRPPKHASPEVMQNLLRFGGFPEPFLKGEVRFFNRWQRLRKEQFLQEDLRDLSLVQEISSLQVLAELICSRAGQLINYSNLANDINVSVDSIRRWLTILESTYYCFSIRPWSRNVRNSLLKQPKLYMWDWTLTQDDGARRENVIASHLLKSIHWWTDIGLGKYGLYYVRDKQKREVDFLVTRNDTPWFLVEVKQSRNKEISSALKYFHKETGATHAFQVYFDGEYVDRNCFEITTPVKVPAETLLSQLI